MRLFVEKVFEGFVSGTDVVYSDAMYNELLGSADRLTVQGNVDQVSGTNPSVVIRSETSDDGEHWVNSGSLAELSLALSPGQATSSIAANDSTKFLGCYVRYNIALSDNVGVVPSAHIRLIVCGRGRYPVAARVPLNPRP